MEATVPSIVDHSKIMYCCSSVQLIWNCVKKRNRIFALPKTTNSLKISAYFSSKKKEAKWIEMYQ